MESYHENTMPILGFYKELGILSTLDATAQIDKVSASVRKTIKPILNGHNLRN